MTLTFGQLPDHRRRRSGATRRTDFHRRNHFRARHGVDVATTAKISPIVGPGQCQPTEQGTSMAPRRRTVSLIAATIGLTATACGGGSTSGLAPSGSTSPTTDHSTSAAPGLATDERLKPGVRYTDASDFTPPVSLAVPTGHWYPYLR